MRCVFTDRTIGMTSFPIGSNTTIGTHGPSEFTNRIRFCILDMSISSCRVSRQKLQYIWMWSHFHFILIIVHIMFICFIPFTGTMNSINLPAPNVWVFIAQLVGLHSSVGRALHFLSTRVACVYRQKDHKYENSTCYNEQRKENKP